MCQELGWELYIVSSPNPNKLSTIIISILQMPHRELRLREIQ